MTLAEEEVLRVAQALVLIFGVIVVYSAAKGYSKRRSGAMLFLALGFALVTAGAIAAGILFELAGTDLLAAEAVQATAQACGFGIIVYSMVGAKE